MPLWCVLFCPIIFSNTASFHGALNWKRHPGKKSGRKNCFPSTGWAVPQSSTVFPHKPCAGSASEETFLELHPQFSPDKESLQIPTMENIFFWHDSSYKRIFVCTVSKKYAVFYFLRDKFLVPIQSLIKQDSLPTAQCCEKPFQEAALSPECPLLIFPGVLARVSVGLLYVSCSLPSTISEILSNKRWCVVLALALAGFGSGHLRKFSWSIWTDGLLCCWWNGWSRVSSPGNTVQWPPFIPSMELMWL